MRVTGLVLAAVFLLTSAAKAQGLWPDADYDPAVPTLEQVVGYAPGERITTHADTLTYLKALADHAPDQVRLFDYGETWEGRKLVYLAVSSPENIENLERFGADMRRLADPRTVSTEEADRLAGDLPASVWLAYSVHGNEISSTDAALQTLYHLLAARNDDRVPQMLDNTVIFINPLQNPDGRDRFIHRFRSALGLEPDSDRISAEHNEPWPSGRTNHYLFDLNRDWISLTQPETRGHVAALQEWYPLVFVDLHEMGGDNTYYFAPEAIPYNPHLIDSQRQSLFDFGRNNARWFDTFGRSYFTRDVYDAFYPGYGASWPAYYGAVAMTYEQASARGLIFRREGGDEMTFRDTVMGHFITSLSTIETVSRERAKLLKNFVDYQRSAIEEGRQARDYPRSYILDGANANTDAIHLAKTLSAQGIEVSRATADFRACGTTYSAGSYVIDAAQPRARMIRTLLEPQVDMNPEFVAEQERRRQLDYDHDIYDVTAWSLPLMSNVTVGRCKDAVRAETTSDLGGAGGIDGNTDNAVAYLLDSQQRVSGQVMAAGLRAGLSMRVHTEGFTLGGRAYPRGTLIILTGENGSDVVPMIRQVATGTGARFQAVASTWVDEGKDLASRAGIPLVKPRIAMAWDEPTSSYSAGNSRFVIERQLGFPVTAIRTDDLAGADLSRYSVLILPESYGGYESTFGKGGIDRLKDWIKRGGVLIAQGTAMRFATDPDVGLLATGPEAQVRPDTGDDGSGTEEASLRAGTLLTSPEELQNAITPAKEKPDSLPGALMKATTDLDHWLTAGVNPDLVVLAQGNDIYAPLSLDDGRNVVWFNGGDNLASGYIWPENKKQLAYKPVTMIQGHGRGYVIGFTQEPTFRAYLDGLNQIYANALFLAPSQARPVR